MENDSRKGILAIRIVNLRCGTDLAINEKGNLYPTGQTVSHEILSAFWKAFRLGVANPGC
jgi:hypothetical protein